MTEVKRGNCLPNKFIQRFLSRANVHLRVQGVMEGPCSWSHRETIQSFSPRHTTQVTRGNWLPNKLTQEVLYLGNVQQVARDKMGWRASVTRKRVLVILKRRLKRSEDKTWLLKLMFSNEVLSLVSERDRKGSREFVTQKTATLVILTEPHKTP